MRHGKTFRKRCLTFLLSLAMVLTSVNVPMLTVWAEEETPIENGSTEMLTTPTDDESSDLTVPADDNEGDEAGETTTPEDGQNPVGGGINGPDDSGESTDPVEGDADDQEGDVTTPEDPEETLKPVAPVEENPVDPKGEENGKAVNNEFEATGTHGATYDEGSKEVTFFVNSDDKCYANITHMWYKEYDSYASAAKNHNSTGNSFITGLGATNFVENDGKKTVTVTVTAGTGAILYYINGEAGHNRLDYEHIIVIDPTAEPSEPEEPEEPTTVPKKPEGLDAKYWEETGSANHGKIYIAWAGVSPDAEDKIQQWKISVDGKELITLNNNPQTSTYFATNVYAAGEHTVTLVAINSKGDSEAATKDFTLTADQAGLKEPKVKNNIVISEQLAQAKVNEKITLSYVADNKDFEFKDYSVKINGTAVSDLTKIAIDTDSGSIEMDASLFTSAGVYKIQFEKEGYNFAPVYQVVYDTNTTDNWNLIWNDEFSGTSLDTTKWDYQTGNGSAYVEAGWGNKEKQIYTKTNTTVGDGKLTITAKKEADGSYTSARLRTVKEEIGENGKAAVGEALQIGAYGKVEAKIKMPTGDGVWPAFWMLPHDSEYGTWAASGEIDIMEARGRLPGEVCGTIHYGATWPNNASYGKTYNFANGDSIDQYHVYTIEWDPTVMKWYVDGELYSSYSDWYSVQSESGNYPYPAPFDEDFYVLLNLALGGTFDSDTNEIDVDEIGVDMDVDYVRWYQRPEDEYKDWEIKKPEIEPDESTEAEELLAMVDENGNFIKDSDFSAMTTTPYTNSGSWEMKGGYWVPLLIPGNGNGKATWDNTVKLDGKNYLKVSVTDVGTQTYSSQMLQYFPVVKGYSYEISYKAYTDTVKQKADVSLKIGGDAARGYAVYSGNYTDILTTKPTTYTHKFTMSADTDPTARFEFNLATSAGNVYLSDVCVKLLRDGISEDDDEDDDKEPLNDGNHVYNGGFNNGSDGLLYWHWGTADELEKVSVVRENKERKAQITATASDPVSMWQYGMNLLQKDEYVLTFDVDSEAAQDIVLDVTNKDGTETYATGTINVAAGESPAKFEFTQPEGKTDTSGKLMLTFAGKAKIDNVKLIRTTYNNVNYDEVDLYPLYNGDFSNGLDGWNIWKQDTGWEEHKVNDKGQLEVSKIKMDQGAAIYEVGIQSRSMTFTRGVNYKVEFDYTLPAEKTYTLELCGIQREITLAAGEHTYKSDAFPGNGGGTFTLYLGPNQTTEYTLLLDNIVVYADLPEKEGYKKPVSLAQDGKVQIGSDVIVAYSGDTAEREEAWGKADKTYYLDAVKIDASKVSLDPAKKTITLDSSLFAEDGEYSFYVEAEGFVATKAISLSVLDASGNLLVNGNFSSGKSGWTFYLADWTAGGSFEVNDEGVAVIEHRYDGEADWHLQLYQDLDYAAGDYIVTFDAWADVERPIAVRIQPDGSSPAFDNANGHVVLSTEKKNYKIMWKGLDAGSANRFDIAMGTMTYDGVSAPNDVHNIYLDNIVFRPLTADDENSMPATIATVGAGKAGADNVTITCTEANDKWQNAAKTVYVNDVALGADKVTDNKTSIVIDKSVFPEGGRYSIYVVAEGFEETNKIFKNMIGSDGNLIFGGDMNDPSQWVVYDEDADNLSEGKISRGIYTLNYKAGYIHPEWNIWVTWSSQLKKENISVEAGTKYVLRFEASTDLIGGRTIEIEYGKAGVEGNPKKTVVIAPGESGVYEVEVDVVDALDDFYINFLLGPIGENLQVNGEVPHTLKIDNVTLRPASEDAAAAKAELEACIAEYKNLTQGEYSDESWAVFTAALTAAQATAADENATTTEITVAINNLKRAAEKLTKPTDKTQLEKLLEKYKDVEGNDAFKAAYAYAQEILNDPEATQKEIDDALAALEEAYQNSKPDDPTPEYHPGLWIRPIPAQTYTGAAIKPEVEVYHDGVLLTIKKDYTVAYKQNTNAGTATVTVTGKGNFKGKDTETFVIEKKNISDEDISVADVYAIINAKGKVTNPKVTVKYGKKTLKLNNDYKVVWPADNVIKDDEGKIKAGVYDITITTEEVKKQKGEYVNSANYTGSKTIKYTVRETGTQLMSKAVIKLTDSKVDYAGENGADTKKPEIKSIKIGGKDVPDTEYTVSYDDNWNKIGKATITVTANEGSVYYGSKSVTYTVNGTKLAVKDLTIEGIEKEYPYTGSEISVNSTLKVTPKAEGSAPYVEGKDYEVSYKTGKKLGEHTNVGTVTVTITGINAYTGSINKTF
ncbi:MAG: family 16 glycosylhydrolase, partial [Lachnospiraceae bacterium]|nr:family 16 glycosylhydrolase [Lachnospiraceae bacterium]